MNKFLRLLWHRRFYLISVLFSWPFLVNLLISFLDKDYFSTFYNTLIILLFLMLSISISILPEIRDWLNTNSASVNTVLVLITIAVTLSLYYVDQVRVFQKTLNLIYTANNLNYKMAQDFQKDKEGQWTYWTYFLTSPYEENLSFINLNMPGDCAIKYISLLMEMKIMNEINHQINEVSIPFELIKERKNDMTTRAEKVENNLKELENNCYIPI